MTTEVLLAILAVLAVINIILLVRSMNQKPAADATQTVREELRAGRWEGKEKTECGIHRASWASG